MQDVCGQKTKIFIILHMYPGFGSFGGISATRLSQLELNQPGTWLKQMGPCRAKTERVGLFSIFGTTSFA